MLPDGIRRIPLEDITLGQRIGAGVFGEAVKATWKGVDVVVKFMFASNEQNEYVCVFVCVCALRLIVWMEPKCDVLCCAVM